MAHVTIEDIAPRVLASVGGTPDDEFTFLFTFFDEDDIQVYVASELLDPGLYTVTGVPGTEGGFEGGTVVLDTPVQDTTVTIVRAIARSRVTDFPLSGPFNINGLNSDLDRIIGLIQELFDKQARTVTLSDDSDSATLTIPAEADRAGKFLAFDSDGDIETVETVGEWRGDWVTATSYNRFDIVRDPGSENVYLVLVAHTSAASIATDIGADRLELLLDIGGANDAAAAAAADAAQVANDAANVAADRVAVEAITGDQPAISGHARQILVVNATGTAYELSETGLRVIPESNFVGIGGTPALPLHIRLTDVTGSVGNPGLSHTVFGSESTDASNQSWAFLGPNTQEQAILFGDVDGANAGAISYAHSTNQLIFRAFGGNRARINSVGLSVQMGAGATTYPVEVTGAIFSTVGFRIGATQATSDPLATVVDVLNPMAASTQASVAHGLNSITEATFYYQCLTAEFGYQIGDKIPVGGNRDAAAARGLTVSWDATNVNVSTDADAILVMNKAAATSHEITEANWKIVAVCKRLA